MIADVHFLRPWWFISLIPLVYFIILFWRQAPKLRAWSEICDSTLLKHLVQSKEQGKRFAALSFVFFSVLFMIISLSGPCWYKMPVATYKTVQPRVLLLDMSDSMLHNDLNPDRLSRAKFKLHDLFDQKNIGQFGLIVYTGEPFIVSPLTEDGQTISSLLSSLTPDIMPVNGNNLDLALQEGKKLVADAGFKQGQMLVLTADTPNEKTINEAKKLANQGLSISIMPVKADNHLNPNFYRFAKAGHGQLLEYSADSSDLDQWINSSTTNEQLTLSQDNDIPLWRDEGRWFLFPALILLLPLFQRGWLKKVEA